MTAIQNHFLYPSLPPPPFTITNPNSTQEIDTLIQACQAKKRNWTIATAAIGVLSVVSSAAILAFTFFPLLKAIGSLSAALEMKMAAIDYFAIRGVIPWAILKILQVAITVLALPAHILAPILPISFALRKKNEYSRAEKALKDGEFIKFANKNKKVLSMQNVLEIYSEYNSKKAVPLAQEKFTAVQK